MNPSVTIIVLNENSRQDTLDCLRSLKHLTYPHTHVIVVDNGSTDGSVDAIQTQFPRITLIATGENLGFTGGNNLGIQHAIEAGADYIMLLSNDAIIAPDMIEVMVAAMKADPSIGVTGPTIYDYDQPDNIWSAGGSINWKRGTTEMIGQGEEDKCQFGCANHQVDFVAGCALMARRETWEKAGLLDDQFFMYYEETEWCVRARRAGFKIAQVPLAMMWRKIPTETSATSPRTFYYMTRNRLLFLRHTRASVTTWLYTLTEYGHTLASWTLRPKWQDRRHLRRVMLRAIKDFSFGNFGQVLV